MIALISDAPTIATQISGGESRLARLESPLSGRVGVHLAEENFSVEDFVADDQRCGVSLRIGGEQPPIPFRQLLGGPLLAVLGDDRLGFRDFLDDL